MFKMLYSQYCLVFFLFFISTVKQVQLITITISNGPVEGIQSQTLNKSTPYCAFLGIRYAQPPIGNLRFRAPVPVSNWTGVYDATRQGNVCVQTENNTVIGDEDCLFINVYTPCCTTNTTLCPVLNWIHGGGFTLFSGNLEPNLADRFLDQGLVVVSVNYRLSAFGFLSTLDTACPGNWGLKDQVLALKWIQKNIAYFGGDPNRVTIFGESAGAASVHYLRESVRARNLFHRCIANSGNTLNPWSISRNAREIAFKLGIQNGIFTLSSKTLVERLRLVAADQLQRSSDLHMALGTVDVLDGLPFAPTPEAPSSEAVYTGNSYESQESGNFNLGALLHGFNSKEVNVPFLLNITSAQYDLFPSRLCPEDMNASPTGRNIVGRNIKSFYFKNQPFLTQPYMSNYLSDDLFDRGIIKCAVLECPYSPVYLYRFSFNEVEGANPLGVGHAQELPFLFKLPFNTSSLAVRLTIERMVQMWSNFVKTGNPTSEITPEVNVAWPICNATVGSTLHYLDIGNELVPSINPQKPEMDFWDEQYEIYGYPPYNTY